MSSCNRMTDEQVARLALAICATAEAIGQVISAEAAELIAEDLAEHPPRAISAALHACRRELKGKLNAAEILQRIQAADGHPDANEAWAMALRAADETDSVVMTDEIQLALAAARPVLALGDKIGARMAFIAAYQRLVDVARREGRLAHWALSPGHDPQRRLAAVEEAGRLGRLQLGQVREYLAQLAHEPITQDGMAIAGLLTGNEEARPSGSSRDRWRELKAMVERQNVATKEKWAAERNAPRAELERKKSEVAAALASLNGRRA